METISYQPIGIIRTPFTQLSDMPIQPSGACGVTGEIHLDSAYVEGLKDLEGFSHIYLIYHFHKSADYKLTVTPFLDTEQRGLFATRAPRRPNSIGLSVVRLQGIRDTVVSVMDIDVLDGTPLLDIKPFVPKFDGTRDAVCGWIDGKAAASETMRSDERFVDKQAE